MIADPPFASSQVAAAFEAFPDELRPGLLRLRRAIFDIAAAMPEVGRVEESLRWGQPAYLTPETRSGTTLRLGLSKAGDLAIFVHCQTTLIADHAHVFGDGQRYDGNRALHLDPGGTFPDAATSHLIRAALTYHL